MPINRTAGDRQSQPMYVGAAVSWKDAQFPLSEFPYKGFLGSYFDTFDDSTGEPVGVLCVQVDSGITLVKNDALYYSDRQTWKVSNVPTNRLGHRAGRAPDWVVGPKVFYMQIEGKGRLRFVDVPTATPNATGLIVVPTATTGKADALAAGTAATYPPFGVTAGVYDAAAKEAVVQLQCPRTP